MDNEPCSEECRRRFVLCDGSGFSVPDEGGGIPRSSPATRWRRIIAVFRWGGGGEFLLRDGNPTTTLEGGEGQSTLLWYVGRRRMFFFSLLFDVFCFLFPPWGIVVNDDDGRRGESRFFDLDFFNLIYYSGVIFFWVESVVFEGGVEKRRGNDEVFPPAFVECVQLWRESVFEKIESQFAARVFFLLLLFPSSSLVVLEWKKVSLAGFSKILLVAFLYRNSAPSLRSVYLSLFLSNLKRGEGTPLWLCK